MREVTEKLLLGPSSNLKPGHVFTDSQLLDQKSNEWGSVFLCQKYI